MSQTNIAFRVSQANLKEQQLTPAQREQCRRNFAKYDTDNSGTLDKQEFRALLEDTLNRKISDNLFAKYFEIQFNATDADYNGSIDFNEFVSLYSKIYLDPELPVHGYRQVEKKVVLETGENAPKVDRQEFSLNPEQLAEARTKFEDTDKNKNGTIDKGELRSLLLQTVGKKMSSTMVNRYVDMQFQMWDKDDSGAIDFDEFTKLYAKMYAHPEGAEQPLGMGLPFPGIGPRS